MSKKVMPEALVGSIDELDQEVRQNKPIRNNEKVVRYLPSENTVSRSATANSDSTLISRKECVVDEFLPVPIKELIISHRIIQLNQQARTLFVRYFMSGEWLNDLFETSVSIYRPFRASAAKQVVAVGSTDPKSKKSTTSHSSKIYLLLNHPLTLSSKSTAVNRVLDLFPMSKLRPLMMAIAMRRYFQTTCFKEMVAEQWTLNIDSVSFRPYRDSSLFGCLLGQIHNHHPLQHLLAAQLPYMSRPEELQDKLAEDKWIWNLQKAIDNLPVGLGIYAFIPDNNNDSSSRQLLGRFFNQSFAQTIGYEPQDLFMTSLDFAASEPFPANTITNIVDTLVKGQSVQVISPYMSSTKISENSDSAEVIDSNNDSVDSSTRKRKNGLMCLSLHPVLDSKRRFVKAICVPRVLAACGPTNCVQDVLVAEHLATLLAAAL